MPEKKERNYRIDLLKIVSVFIIVFSVFGYIFALQRFMKFPF